MNLHIKLEECISACLCKHVYTSFTLEAKNCQPYTATLGRIRVKALWTKMFSTAKHKVQYSSYALQCRHSNKQQYMMQHTMYIYTVKT
jgi:hypothetical protein